MGRNQASMSAEEFIEFYACRNANLVELAQNHYVSTVDLRLFFISIHHFYKLF